MINKNTNPVAWALMLAEIDEAQEHLRNLMNRMHAAGTMDEAEFATYLGHVYAHLNRVWNSRNQDTQLSEEQWSIFSQFPKDIKPVG